MTRVLQLLALVAVFAWLTLAAVMEVAPAIGWTWRQVLAGLFLALIVAGASRSSGS